MYDYTFKRRDTKYQNIEQFEPSLLPAREKKNVAKQPKEDRINDGQRRWKKEEKQKEVEEEEEDKIQI